MSKKDCDRREAGAGGGASSRGTDGRLSRQVDRGAAGVTTLASARLRPGGEATFRTPHGDMAADVKNRNTLMCFPQSNAMASLRRLADGALGWLRAMGFRPPGRPAGPKSGPWTPLIS